MGIDECMILIFILILVYNSYIKIKITSDLYSDLKFCFLT